MILKAIPIILSVALHGGLAYKVLAPSEGTPSLEKGTGADLLLTKEAVTIESIVMLGDAPEQVQAAIQEALRPTTQEPKSEKKLQPEEKKADVLPAPPKPPEQPHVKPTPPVQTAALKRDKSAGKVQHGGASTARSAYIGKLHRRIARRAINPNSRKRGTAIVHLVIGPDGNLISSKITKSSGSALLDRTALRSVKRAAPFPTIPKSVGQNTVSLAIPFRYRVR